MIFEKKSLDISDNKIDFKIVKKPTKFNVENSKSFLEDLKKYYDSSSTIQTANDTNFPILINDIKNENKFALICLQNEEKQGKEVSFL